MHEKERAEFYKELDTFLKQNDPHSGLAQREEITTKLTPDEKVALSLIKTAQRIHVLQVAKELEEQNIPSGTKILRTLRDNGYITIEDGMVRFVDKTT